MKNNLHHFGRTKLGVQWDVYEGDAGTVLKTLPSSSFDTIITSPPYFWLRDYSVKGQLGHEDTVEEYVNAIADAMDGVHRVLKKEGLLFLNLGDTYYSGKGESQGTDKKSTKRRFGLRAVDKSGGLGIGMRPKSMIGIPWRVAIEMMSRKWAMRSAIVWHRKHALSEAVRDRPRRSYENVFMFSKDRNYFFNRAALQDIKVEEDVWTIAAKPRANSIDTAPFPDELVKRCLDIGCPPGGSVLDPFGGGGTTIRVAVESGRPASAIDLNPLFCNYMVQQLKRTN